MSIMLTIKAFGMLCCEVIWLNIYKKHIYFPYKYGQHGLKVIFLKS